MLSKSATMLLGLVCKMPRNAYEITKQLQIMNVSSWYNIANSTVYATLKTLEKKEYIYGIIEKDGNMPDKTISIAAFFIDILENREELLNKRLVLLNNYKVGIEKQLKVLEDNTSLVTLANIERSKLIVEAEILGTKNLLSAILMEK